MRVISILLREGGAVGQRGSRLSSVDYVWVWRCISSTLISGSGSRICICADIRCEAQTEHVCTYTSICNWNLISSHFREKCTHFSVPQAQRYPLALLRGINLINRAIDLKWIGATRSNSIDESNYTPQIPLPLSISLSPGYLICFASSCFRHIFQRWWESFPFLSFWFLSSPP